MYFKCVIREKYTGDLCWYWTDGEICHLPSFFFKTNEWKKTEVPKLNQIRTCWTQHGCRGCLLVVCFEFPFRQYRERLSYCFSLLLWDFILVGCSVSNHCCVNGLSAWEGWSQLSELCNHFRPGLRPPRNGHTCRMFSMFSPQHCLLFEISIFFLSPSRLITIYEWKSYQISIKRKLFWKYPCIG